MAFRASGHDPRYYGREHRRAGSRRERNWLQGLLVTLLFLTGWKAVSGHVANWPPEVQGTLALLGIRLVATVVHDAPLRDRQAFFWEDVGKELLLYAGAGVLAGLAARGVQAWWQVEVSLAWPATGVYWISLLLLQ